ncbi:hypothetical protein RAC81_15605 [Microbacterium sp. CR_7]
MMDLAPGCRDMASRNEAFLVASDDRASLMRGEHPVGAVDADDPPLAHRDALDRSGAPRLRGDPDRHLTMRIAVGTGQARPSRARFEIPHVDGDDECRRRTAQGRHVSVARGDAERGSERIVTLLRRRRSPHANRS